MAEIIKYGTPPNEDDEYWLNEANNTTPEKSIERIDILGRYIFSTVSIIGTLLTGFNLLSPSGSDEHVAKR